MPELVRYQAQVRTCKGKGSARRLRAEGNVPAIFYGADNKNIPLTVNQKSFLKLYETVGSTGVFELDITGNGTEEKHNCLVWKVVYHPYKKQVTHIDFLGVNLEKPLKVKVPLVISGVSKGVKLGGRLEVYREQVTILAKPLALPAQIDIDISDLDINQGISVEDLKLPDGVSVPHDTNFAILSIIPPRNAETESADSKK